MIDERMIAMKTSSYEQPKMDVVVLNGNDVVCASDTTPGYGGGNPGNDNEGSAGGLSLGLGL